MRQLNTYETIPVYTYRYNSFRRSWEIVEHFFMIERFEIIRCFPSESQAEEYVVNMNKKVMGKRLKVT